MEAAKPLIALIGVAVCAGGAAAQPAALTSGGTHGLIKTARGFSPSS
ncbi:MAG: hypothetical protein ACRDNH_02590 [Gaiellaceae bacterium]